MSLVSLITPTNNYILGHQFDKAIWHGENGANGNGNGNATQHTLSRVGWAGGGAWHSSLSLYFNIINYRSRIINYIVGSFWN